MIENQLAQATEDLRTRLRTVYQWVNELPQTQEQTEWLAQTFAELHTSLEVLEIAQEQLEYKFWQQTAELQRVSKQLQTEVRKSQPVEEMPQEHEEGYCTNFEQGTPGIEDISNTYRQTTQSQQTTEQLRTSLQEQEILVEEIHHRVKNNLQIVSSLLYLQANRSNDPQVHAILQESRNRVESMALVHESLSRSGEPTRINFTEYVHNLATNLFSIYNVQPSHLALRISAPTDIFINLDKAIPCGLIINELITNALKNSFMPCNQGEISLKIERSPNSQIILRVGNSSQNLPVDLDLQNTQSMGLRLVMTLVKQLKGTIEVNQEEVAVFKIKFII